MGTIENFLIICIIVCLYILLPRSMAKKRGRSTIVAIILFVFLTPLWGAVVLLLLGDSKAKLKQDILDEINRDKNEEQNDE